MLRTLNDLERYKVHATDGDVGRVVNFLLDDEQWVVRYLVVEVGFLNARRVLISPISFRDVEWRHGHFHLVLTKDQIRNSPSVDTDKPVSRQHEWDYDQYYGYAHYWGGGVGLWGLGPYPMELRGNASPGQRDRESGDVHLRSAREVCGYEIRGTDGAIGHVGDFIVDDDTWTIRYLMVDTANWWFGKKVLVAPHWATRVSWPERTVHVQLSRDQIKSSPEWGGTAAINREYEARLYDYYGRPVYWTGEDRLNSVPRPRPVSLPGAVSRHEGGR